MKNFNVITLPGGEQHVKYIGKDLGNDSKSVRIYGIVTANKLIAADMACEIYSRLCKYKHNTKLILPYMPGARQDRVDIPEVGFSLKIYSDIINSIWTIKDVIILDPHSEATIKQLTTPVGNEEETINPIVINHQDWFLPWIESTTFKPGPHRFLFPDKGASIKYGKVNSYSPNLSCTKHRDPDTGQLSHFEVPDLRSWEDNFIWIVDDICDGGGTFISIAQQVRSQLGNKCQLGLAVSHGIFSKGVGDLTMLFNYIVTTDSVYEGQFGKCVHMFKLENIL